MKRNRIIAVVLAVSLSLTLLVHPLFAWSYPSEHSDIDTLWNLYQGANYADWIAQKNLQYDRLSSLIVDESSNVVISCCPFGSGTGLISWFACSGSRIAILNKYVYISELGDSFNKADFSTYGYSSVGQNQTQSLSGYIDVDGHRFYATGVQLDIRSDSLIYCTCPLYINGTLYTPPNLGYGSLEPDHRVLSCTKEVKYPFSSNPLEYIHISVDDNPSDSFVALTYEDGNGDIRTSTIFPESYVNLHDIEGTGVFWSFDIPPYLLSGYEFTLTQCTYWSSSSWGTKTIDVDLIFYEGERYPLSTNWNNIYYVTEFAESQDNGSVVYGLTTLYLSYQYEGVYYYYDYEWSSCQPFTIKVLFMPAFMNNPSSISANIDWLYQIYEQYDLIFFGLDESTFNLIFSQYNNFNYNSLNLLWQVNEEDAIESLTKREPKYINSNKSVKNELSAQYYQSDVGVIYTRSFLLKRISSSLGDIDDRLLEFETGLIGEDGALVSVQTKLNNIYKGQNDFFNGINDFVLKWDYWLDNYDVSDKLDSIVSRLDSILTFLEGDLSIDLDGLEHPWIDFYNFIKRAFDGAQRYLGNFTSSASAILDGSDMTKLPVPSISVEPALPFNPSLSPIPYPSFIPIPTLSGGG